MNGEQHDGPLVSILLPTHNRSKYLPVALSSAVHQSYRNLQIIVIRDGGEPVGDIVEIFDDRRISFIDRDENRGKAASLNEALAAVRGKYVAYLDDDDIIYPRHIETLVHALETQTDCQLAYTDLYRTYCRVEPNGDRQVLSKVVEISRDFDRYLMLCFNHTLHVSLMHRAGLLDKTGPFNEQLNVLIDWDLTRRACFFTDFHHVHEITGEFYSPVGRSDRLSVLGRTDAEEYLRNFTTIRTTRPPKPWPKIKDLSIILLADCAGPGLNGKLAEIQKYTFYPHRIIIPVTSVADAGFAGTDLSDHIKAVSISPAASQAEILNTALAACDGDYVAVVPADFPIRNFWLEDSLYPLLNSEEPEAFELEDSTDSCRAVVAARESMLRAHRQSSSGALIEALASAGVNVRRVEPHEIPFQFDQLLCEAKEVGSKGDWPRAAEIFEYMSQNHRNESWMQSMAAQAYYNCGFHQKAAELCRIVNHQKPTVDTLLLEGRLHRAAGDFGSAITMLERARTIVEGKETLWT